MHPAIMQQLAADHIRELITEAADAQQRQSRLSPGPSSRPAPRTLVRPSADDRPAGRPLES